jgi:ParB-like chromosome segregation protein Spo0J
MTELVNINKLKLLKRNPRTISKAQFEKLKQSLINDPNFLDHRPILINVIDDEYHVYAGNQRVRAAKQLGWKQITCSIDHNLSDEQMKKRIILDNAHYGENDFDILANDFEIDMLIDCGYTEKELHLDDSANDLIEDSNKNEKDSKTKLCPHCNGEL